jgi:hypothetical protein
VRLARARDAVAAEAARVEREVEPAESLDHCIDRGSGHAGKQQILLPGDARLGAEGLEQVTECDEPLAAQEADVHRNADTRKPVRLLADAEVVVGLDGDRRQGEGRQRVAEPLLDLRADALGAEGVDHELHARLDARDAPPEIVAPGVEDGAEHGNRLVGPDEHAEVAGDPRHRRQTAADEDAEAGLSVAEDPDERDAVDLGRVAPGGAGRDRDLVLAREVDVLRVAGEEPVRLLEDGRHVEQLVGVAAGRRAARDRADRVAAAAEAGEPRCVQPGEHLRQRGQPQVMELDVLARRQLGLTLPVVEREAPDGPELRSGQPPGGELDPQHEGPDLRLVVVEAPPLEPDDILLCDVGVAGRDQRGQLLEHPERPLLALEALDRVPLEHELERGCLGLGSSDVDAHPPPLGCPDIGCHHRKRSRQS